MAKKTEVAEKEPDVAQQQPEQPPAPQLPAVVAAAPQVPLAAAPQPQGLPVTGFANLATAISEVTAGIADEDNRVQKHGKNAFHNYKYATMQDILQKLAPLMAQHGIVVMQREVSRGWMDDGAAINITYEFTIIHKSGEVWPEKQVFTGLSNCRTRDGKFDDKAINKCHTAARKYFLLALFQIPTEDENDADRGDNDGAPRTTSQKARERIQAPQQEPEKTVEKKPPYELPVNEKTKMLTWAGEYIAQINLCDKTADVTMYRNLNADALAKIEAAKPDIYEKIKKAETLRLVALT